MVGLLAAFVHRYQAGGVDVGLILSLLAAAAAGLVTRALGGREGTVWLAVFLLAAVVLVRFVAPGGDRIVLDDARGNLLTTGLPAVALVLALFPDAWFRPRV